MCNEIHRSFLLLALYVHAGKRRRLTLIECPNDVSCMIDVAKVADLVSEGVLLLLLSSD